MMHNERNQTRPTRKLTFHFRRQLKSLYVPEFVIYRKELSTVNTVRKKKQSGEQKMRCRSGKDIQELQLKKYLRTKSHKRLRESSLAASSCNKKSRIEIADDRGLYDRFQFVYSIFTQYACIKDTSAHMFHSKTNL